MARRPVLTSRPRSARFSLPLREAELLTAGVTPVGTPRLAVGAAGVESDQVAAAWSRTDAVAGLLFMGGMRRSEIAAIRWAAVADDPGGDGILVTVRRRQTNQGGETNDVRFVKDGLLVPPVARSGSAKEPPHAMSGRSAVFVNARIVRRRFRPAVVRSSCSSQHRRAAWRASIRSRWRSAATASRRRTRSAPMGSATVTGSGCRGMG